MKNVFVNSVLVVFALLVASCGRQPEAKVEVMSFNIRLDHVADHVVFGAQCGVISDVKEPATLLGAPAINAKAFMRSSAIFNRLPDMYRQMGQMQREIERLKLAIDNARNGQ